MLYLSETNIYFKNIILGILCEHRCKTQLVISWKKFPVVMKKLEKKEQQNFCFSNHRIFLVSRWNK